MRRCNAVFIALAIVSAWWSGASAQDQRYPKFLTLSYTQEYAPVITAGWYYPQNFGGNFHGAIDYGLPEGASVVAVADGIVGNLHQGQTFQSRESNDPRFTGNVKKTGNLVRIDHPNGFKTYYAHLQVGSNDHLKVSDPISRGQLIGKVGNTGWTVGSNGGYHLHFEVDGPRDYGCGGSENYDPYNICGNANTNYNTAATGSNYLWTTNPPSHAPQFAIGQFPPWGIAGLNQSEVQPKFRAMTDEILTAYRRTHPSISIEPYSNNPGKMDDGKYVHEWVKNNDRLVVQDVLIRNAGLTHERGLLVLAGDGSRTHAVKEGFYWLFMQYDTGMPLGNEQLSQAGVGQVYQRFDRAIAYWDNTNKVLALKDYGQQVIAQYTNPTFVIAANGDNTVVLDEPEPEPDPVIPLSSVALVIMPAEPGYRYQLSRGQEQMTLNLQLNHAGGNAPFVYRFYAGTALITQGADAFCSMTLAPGTHSIRTRVEAGSGNTAQSQEVSQQVVVEAAPKSDWGVPFEVHIKTIAHDGQYIYIAGAYVSGPNAGNGYLGRANRNNPTVVESFTFGFTFNEILLRDSYLFAATTSGLMVSMDWGASWSTVYSNGQAYDIAILPGDKWADWPVKILVGCSRGVDYGNWFPSEPNTLRDVRIIGSFGPYTLDGGRYRTRDYLFIIASGNGISSRRAPWHLAYVENAGSLAGSGGGRAYSIRSEDNMALAALQRNAGDNVYYNSYYGDSWAWEKVRGIPQGDDVVAFAWISGLGWGAITATGNLYCAPSDPTRWRPIAGFKEALGLDLAAGQTATCMKEVGPDMLIGTARGLRAVAMERITRLASKPVADSEQPASAPTLLGNYPNPFNAKTAIRYQIAEEADVRVTVYNMLGRVVATLVAERQTPGTYKVMWDGLGADGRPVGTGVYLYCIMAGEYTQVNKMTLLR